MALPNLFLPGAAKSGSTSLHVYLSRHPEIFMSNPKEPCTLAFDDDVDRIRAGYESLFAGAESALVRGESSQWYLTLPELPQRMYRTSPRLKLVFVFRNPIDRAWSHHRWLTWQGIERREFLTALQSERGTTPRFHHGLANDRVYYLESGRYGHHLRRYLQYFDPANVQVLTTDELARDPAGSVQSVMKHVGVEPIPVDVSERQNVTGALRFPRTVNVLSGHEVVDPARRDLPARVLTYCSRLVANTRGVHFVANRIGARLGELDCPVPVLSPHDRQWLVDYYRDDVACLREITGRAFDEWASDFPLSSSPSMA